MSDRLVIRSYRRVFNVDRRVYKVDRWMLPVPGGVPLRGIGYFVAVLLAVLLAGGLPGFDLVLGVLTPPLRYVLLPLTVAVLGTQVAPDGRQAHRFALGWLAWRLRARRRCAGRPVPLEGEPVAWRGRLAVRHDVDSPRLRRARITGVARVTFNVPVELRHRRGALVARGSSNGEVPQTLVTSARQRLEVRP